MNIWNFIKVYMFSYTNIHYNYTKCSLQTTDLCIQNGTRYSKLITSCESLRISRGCLRRCGREGGEPEQWGDWGDAGQWGDCDGEGLEQDLWLPLLLVLLLLLLLLQLSVDWLTRFLLISLLLPPPPPASLRHICLRNVSSSSVTNSWQSCCNNNKNVVNFTYY